MNRPLLACVVLILMTASAWASDGTTVNAGATQDITAHSVCKRVTNNAGVSVYVPTTSAAEWASFYGAPPSAVSVSACPPTCGGFSHGGYCWYLSAVQQSCTTACASRGGTTVGTINYTGTSGSLANCASVAQGLGVSYSNAIDFSTTNYTGVGCFSSISGGNLVRDVYLATNQDAILSWSGNARRICSCVQ